MTKRTHYHSLLVDGSVDSKSRPASDTLKFGSFNGSMTNFNCAPPCLIAYYVYVCIYIIHTYPLMHTHTHTQARGQEEVIRDHQSQKGWDIYIFLPPFHISHLLIMSQSSCSHSPCCVCKHFLLVLHLGYIQKTDASRHFYLYLPLQNKEQKDGQKGIGCREIHVEGKWRRYTGCQPALEDWSNTVNILITFIQTRCTVNL